ncbi:transposase [Chryseobacterium sp.]|uniref:transposase n=1 Tax=Chryseobacterium sp. TaxID=1871047 RepID=UPI00289AC40D|nr:transposase [Chryseobacterium sp.]
MSDRKKLTNEEKYSIAQDLYLETDKTQKEIAEIVGVTEKTLGKWKWDGEWELLKSASTVTSRKIIDNLYKRAYELSENPKSKPDDIIKIANSIEKLSNKKVTVSHIINVFKDFTAYAFNQDADLAKKINLMQKKYVDFKIGEK